MQRWLWFLGLYLAGVAGAPRRVPGAATTLYGVNALVIAAFSIWVLLRLSWFYQQAPVATALALVWYFRKDWARVVRGAASRAKAVSRASARRCRPSRSKGLSMPTSTVPGRASASSSGAGARRRNAISSRSAFANCWPRRGRSTLG